LQRLLTFSLEQGFIAAKAKSDHKVYFFAQPSSFLYASFYDDDSSQSDVLEQPEGLILSIICL
uniref:Fuz_longin_1 domain-containing protein n=1 Tax=Anisakis simplex TaxID=6269 RepID=A0A0M3KA70_ANISI